MQAPYLLSYLDQPPTLSFMEQKQREEPNLGVPFSRVVVYFELREGYEGLICPTAAGGSLSLPCSLCSPFRPQGFYRWLQVHLKCVPRTTGEVKQSPPAKNCEAKVFPCQAGDYSTVQLQAWCLQGLTPTFLQF